jgi:poly(3-hydroxybutyrate) depolymerase
MLRGSLLVVLLVTVGVTLAQRKLPKYNVDRTQISVSGPSSGACMATQMHVAYSSLIMGVAILAGAPYYCAKGFNVIAVNACANTPNDINMSDLIAQTNRYAASNDVDPTSNMRNDRIFIFHGNQDSVIHPGVSSRVVEYYQTYVEPANIRLLTMNAEHTFPTEDYGNACSYKGSPYFGRCNYNVAYEILNHFYGGNLVRPSGNVPLSGEFYEFDQRDFFYFTLPVMSSMDNSGYVYVPSGCVNNQNRCRLHVSFHGCQQYKLLLGAEYALNTGFNQVGELNNIIILYPQAISTGPNPLGCWDWWGYTSLLYATKGAQQPLAVYRMVEQIS